MCGEKSANSKVRDTMEGASPRMRGKVFFFTGVSFCAIFFLEPSGNLLLEPSGSSWVPPDGSIFVFAIGSPPRMRGKAFSVLRRQFRFRIIPAYAGKRAPVRRGCARRGDHPRICGEKDRGDMRNLGEVGSPPRVRGKVAAAWRTRSVAGITPACAGKSHRSASFIAAVWDHPRVCGEKTMQKPKTPRNPGSPPRVRGKGDAAVQRLCAGGITPAYAGKSYHSRHMVVVIRDHPRVCGEKFNCNPGSPQHWGSPPRMRGKARLPDHVGKGGGITPACAGKSCCAA